MVSVCLAAHNGSRYIAKQLTSILSQLPADGELVIVDDCSTDNTTDMISAYNDGRIKLIKNAENIGAIRSFERALMGATGDYVLLSDQDDYWHPDKVETMTAALADADLVLHDAFIVNDNDTLIHESLYGITHPHPGAIRNLARNTIVGCCLGISRTLLSKVLPFPRRLVSHDWWIGVAGAAFGNLNIIDSKLTYYRRHQHNVSSLTERSRRPILRRVTSRLYLGVQLLFRAAALRSRAWFSRLGRTA